MKQAMQLRLSQQLMLTPQLQQSIRLLQLSTLEMHQELEQMLSENPLLERVDNPLDYSAGFSSESAGCVQTERLPSALKECGMTEQTEQAERLYASDNDESSADKLEQFDFSMSDTSRFNRLDEFSDYEQAEIAQTTLREYLLEQMRLTVRKPQARFLVEMLIEAVDHNGYLEETLEEIHARLSQEWIVPKDDLLQALSTLQSFEPAGVGARNISECLALQLKRNFLCRADLDVGVELALRIVESHLSLLASRDFVKLRKILDCSEENLRQSYALIKQCQPYPGSEFSAFLPEYIQPDIIVKNNGRNWEARLNQEVIPRLRVPALYETILKKNKAENNLMLHLQEAKWLIKNIQQRFSTLLRVSQAIVERQRNFFSCGAVAMRPLVLREIADILNLHESTISRITTRKYMMTPHGIFELKYFFSSHVATEAGGEVSSIAVRELIRQLIAEENPARPFSDTRIAALLGEQGMLIARRTVAKYREALKIPAVPLRRSW